MAASAYRRRNRRRPACRSCPDEGESLGLDKVVEPSADQASADCCPRGPGELVTTPIGLESTRVYDLQSLRLPRTLEADFEVGALWAMAFRTDLTGSARGAEGVRARFPHSKCDRTFLAASTTHEGLGRGPRPGIVAGQCGCLVRGAARSGHLCALARLQPPELALEFTDADPHYSARSGRPTQMARSASELSQCHLRLNKAPLVEHPVNCICALCQTPEQGDRRRLPWFPFPSARGRLPVSQ